MESEMIGNEQCRLYLAELFSGEQTVDFRSLSRPICLRPQLYPSAQPFLPVFTGPASTPGFRFSQLPSCPCCDHPLNYPAAFERDSPTLILGV